MLQYNTDISDPLSACVISEWSERQAAIHHLLLLLCPGGLRADPLLLQREASSILQCWHWSCESHRLCVLVCMCVSAESNRAALLSTARQVTAMKTPQPCLTSSLFLPSPLFFCRILALKPPQAFSPPSHFGGSRGGFTICCGSWAQSLFCVGLQLFFFQ